ncbi:GDP-L-fucose synthase [Candidatus Pacearchaeota archaeon]|nr:GDP-L-fucose synthase [Candidatus Pacearchaeota archaeon]
MEEDSKIYIPGHKGMVGSAIVRILNKEGYKNLIFREHSELDLIRQKETEDFFMKEKPDYVFHAAARVGGISENINFPADFILENLQIQTNIINSAYKSGVKKLMFIGSNCIYPRECPQPMREEYLWTGRLEPTNKAFAAAKIAGIEMCLAYNKQHKTRFISVIPASLFGENDDYDAMNSHFVPALIRKFHEAKKNNSKEVVLWGTGNPRRELMHVDDFADAALFLMNNYDSSEPINVGTGEDRSIKEISEIVKKIVEFKGEIVFDKTNPDGMMQKLLDSSKINSLGWMPKTGIEEGIRKTYEWYVKENERKRF